MFSLIITIISIALVAALALATLYYGGNSFNKGSAAAKATEIVNQSEQLRGAMALYRVDHGTWPLTLNELVAKNYLKAIPTTLAQGPRVELAQTAQAAQTLTWTMPQEGVPTVTLTNVGSLDVCREVNLKARGDNGVLRQAYTALSTQCFGDEGSLQVLVTLSPASIADVLPAGTVGGTNPPAESVDAAWTAKPSAVVASASPASGPTPSSPSSGGAGNFVFANVMTAYSPNAVWSQTAGGYTLLQKPELKTAQAENTGSLNGFVIVTLQNKGEAAPIPAELNQLHVVHGDNLDPSLCRPGQTLEKDGTCNFYIVGYHQSLPAQLAPLCSAPVDLFGSQLPKVTLDTCLYSNPYIELQANSYYRNNIFHSRTNVSPEQYTNNAMVVSVYSGIANLSDVSLELVSPANLTLTGTNLVTGTPYSLQRTATGKIFSERTGSLEEFVLNSGSGFITENGGGVWGDELNTSRMTATDCSQLPKGAICNLLQFFEPLSSSASTPGQQSVTYRVKFRVNGGPLMSKDFTSTLKWGNHTSD